MLKNTRVDISFIPLLQEFKVQSLQLQILLFTLAAPMIAMVFYYIVMNARQSLDRQRTVIAVIRSRGGSTGQIIWIYLLEGLLLGAAALLLGPLLGWLMAKSIGSSSGFLTFVDRKAVPVGVSTEALLYGAAAVVIAILASVIPAIVFARASIVSYKQKLARSDRRPFWQKWFLDVLLLGLVGYGYYLFGQRQDLFSRTGMTTDQLQVHPLLFFYPGFVDYCPRSVFPARLPVAAALRQLAGQTGTAGSRLLDADAAVPLVDGLLPVNDLAYSYPWTRRV